MFQFPAFAFSLYAFSIEGSPIRTSMDYRSLAPPHGFSQLATSFVASESLGILRTPLFGFRLCLCFYRASLYNI